MNLAGNLVATVATHPSRVAIRLDDHAITYEGLDEASARVAGWLGELGIGPGDRVGLMLPNLPQFPVIYYGILRAGAVVVPMNPLFKSREVEYYLADSEASALFAWEGVATEAAAGAAAAGTPFIEVPTADFASELMQHPAVGEVVDRAPDDTAVILYTSGTTGKPKGAELTTPTS